MKYTEIFITIIAQSMRSSRIDHTQEDHFLAMRIFLITINGDLSEREGLRED